MYWFPKVYVYEWKCLEISNYKQYQMSMNKNFQELIKAALYLLLDCYDGIYTQRQVVTMLNQLNVALKPSALNKLKKDIETGKQLGKRRAKRYGGPLEELVNKLLGQEYDVELNKFIPTENTDWQPENLLPIEEQNTVVSLPENRFLEKVYDTRGRWSTADKVRFFSTAKKEVIEFGVKLENFSTYFDKYGDAAYKQPIIELLKRGVNVKCYMLEPDSNTARFYFEDRAKANEEESTAIEKLPKIQKKLLKIATSLNNLGHDGRFEIYTYKNIPYNHFLSVDLDIYSAKMVIAHYIYGVGRAKSPLVVITKKDHPSLYELYATSLRAFLAQAKKVFP